MLTDYLFTYYALFIMLGGILILTFYDVFLDRRMIRCLRIATFLILALSLSDTLEKYYAEFDHVTVWRYIFSSLSYTIRPTIMVLIIFMVHRTIRFVVILPAVINMFFAFSWLFTDVVFYFDKKNVFVRGPLAYTAYVISAIYLLYLLILSIKFVSEDSYEESQILFFIALAAIGAALFGIWLPDTETVVNYTFGADVLLYYLYTYFQFTKRDALTGLYNRQTYYNGIRRYEQDVLGVISIDMNNLKWLNDTYGHDAGDQGLVALSECIKNELSFGDKAYRIGGDEFVIFCRNSSGDIEQISAKIRSSVTQKGYSCALGCTSEGSISQMIKEADRLMYEDKARIKKQMKLDGRMPVRD
jgi:diguanylate cyclase (GGDEF)-like protein